MKFPVIVFLLAAVVLSACQTTGDRSSAVDLTLIEVTAGVCKADVDWNNKTYKGKIPDGHVYNARDIGDGWIRATIGFHNTIWMVAHVNPHKNLFLCNSDLWPQYKHNPNLPKADRGQLTHGLKPLKEFAPLS